MRNYARAGFLVCLLLASGAGVASAGQLGDAQERDVLYVVDTVPVFDGTGYASQRAIWYTPHGGRSVTGYEPARDYYSVARGQHGLWKSDSP